MAEGRVGRREGKIKRTNEGAFETQTQPKLKKHGFINPQPRQTSVLTLNSRG
jgi:hypothetical protein